MALQLAETGGELNERLQVAGDERLAYRLTPTQHLIIDRRSNNVLAAFKYVEDAREFLHKNGSGARHPIEEETR